MCRALYGVDTVVVLEAFEMQTLLRSIRYGLRQLRRAPTFTVVAVLTLALGVGANTAIFSVIQAVLLHPAGISEPERVASFHVRYTQLNLPSIGVSVPDFKDAQSLTGVVDSAALSRPASMFAQPWTQDAAGDLRKPLVALFVVVAAILPLPLPLSLLVLRRHSERSEESPHFRGERSDPSAFLFSPPNIVISTGDAHAFVSIGAEKPLLHPHRVPAHAQPFLSLSLVGASTL